MGSSAVVCFHLKECECKNRGTVSCVNAFYLIYSVYASKPVFSVLSPIVLLLIYYGFVSFPYDLPLEINSSLFY